MLRGTLPVVPTPFLNGDVDLASIDSLVSMTEEFVDGYVVCGSTGESPSMSTAERISFVRHFARRAQPGKELVVGLNGTSLVDAVQIGLASKDVGVTHALVPSPYYFPNTLSMVIDYLGQLAEKTELNIVFYDNPTTTKTSFSAGDIASLAKAVPAIKAVKVTEHNIPKVQFLKRVTNLQVFAGDDILLYRFLQAGVDGTMVIAPLVFPQQFRQCWEALLNQRDKEAFDIFSRAILPFIHMFGPGDEIATTKALLHHLDVFNSAETRSPLLPASGGRIREVLAGYEQGVRGSRNP